MEVNKIYNEDCLKTMSLMDEKSIDLILTSPPYNTSRKGNSIEKGCANIRYDGFNDMRDDKEYIDWTIKLFLSFNTILIENGCVLYNMSYSSEKTYLMWDVIHFIQSRTNFIVADCIAWKKPSTSPNSCSCNKLTRIIEYVFVLCRKQEFMTFNCFKGISSCRKTGQKSYCNVMNLIEAPCNDGVNGLNFATFSSVLVRKLLKIYAKENYIVYDPFMGTGTTAIGCIREKCNFIGSELSLAQCKYAEKRIYNETRQLDLFK